jgi:hypothetical protein
MRRIETFLLLPNRENLGQQRYLRLDGCLFISPSVQYSVIRHIACR